MPAANFCYRARHGRHYTSLVTGPVTSSHSAEELHERFKIGETIAVINKTDPKQQEAFLMILDSVMKK